jgi:hypothetical protein
MPKITLKTFIKLVIPVVVAMTTQTAAASNPYHAGVQDRVAAHRQLWNGMPSFGGTALDDTVDVGGGTTVNDPNVYRDGQPVPDYDINPHGG